ncbi:MAG: MCE family protein [Candidatus Sericytochromatia bacterium]|nr:MCE family protein [Candidatus Sericytochromatia bacterium]
MKKTSSEVALGLFILASAGLLGYMSLAVGGLRLGHGRHVSAEFGNAAGLVKDAAVMIAGVEVGKIESLTVKHDKALVKIFLRDEASVRQDVIAAIRAKSLLGEKYLELRPQSESAPMLEDGGTIVKTEFPLEMDQLVNSARPLIAAIDPKDMTKLVKTVTKIVDKFDADKLDMNKLAQIIDDGSILVAKARVLATDPQLAADLGRLRRTGVKLVNEHGDQIGRMIDANEKFITALAPEAKHIAATLRRADDITAQLDRKYLPLLDKWAVTGEKLRPTVERLPSVFSKMEPVLDKLPTFFVKLEPVMDKLPALVGKMDTSLDKMQPLLRMTQEKELRQFIQKEGIRINFW